MDKNVIKKMKTYIENSLILEKWAKPNFNKLNKIKVGNKEYYYEKTLNNKFRPNYILHGKNGARYGLFSGNNPKEFFPLNLKSKRIVKSIGKFVENESGLVYKKDIKHSLNEGGNAVKNELLGNLQKLNKQKLEYVRIPNTKIKEVFKIIIDPLLKDISKFLDPDYEITFDLGSTRLAAHIAGKKVKLLRSETPDVMDKAFKSKKSYGDFDLDLVLKSGVSMEDVGNYLVKKDPSKISFRKSKIMADEILTAIRWGKNKVIQVDLVQIEQEEAHETKFMQSSSFVDLASGVKGALQKWFIRAILQEREKTQAENVIVKNELENNEEIIKLKEKGWEPRNYNGDGTDKIGRFQLGKGGIYLVVDLFKPNVKTKKSIKLSKLTNFSDTNNVASYILPGADEDDIISAVKMAKKVKEQIPGKAKNIWDTFFKLMESQKQTIDEEDYNLGMSTIANILGVNFDNGENNG